MKTKVGLLLLAVFMLVVPAFAVDNATPIRISQGDAVYLGETVDISGVTGWASQIAWAGGYDSPMSGTTPTTLELPDTKKGYYNYYIDPSIFGNYYGRWYQWYGQYEPAGNTAAFTVVSGTRPIHITEANVTNTTVNTGNFTIDYPIAPPTILPEVHVSNYLVAVGDPFTVNTAGGGKVWLFGTEDSLYDLETKRDNITITPAQTATLSPGQYSLLIQTAGKNGEYDVRYYNNSIQWRSEWSGIKSESISGIQPLLVVGKLQDIIGKTDDNYIILNVVVEFPQSTIESMWETQIPADNFEFINEPGLVTWFDVRGYTNHANGTQLKVYLDKTEHTVKDINKYTFSATAIRTSAGNKSQYEAFVPIVWDRMDIGMHTISVVGPDGTITNADFPVSVMPADSYRPNATIKYAGDRNPYIPPTYINTTVTVVQTIEVVKEVIVEVPPAQEVVEAAQQKAVNDAIGFYGSLLIVLALISIIGYYTTNVYRRAKKR